jgi:hypothetical protein
MSSSLLFSFFIFQKTNLSKVTIFFYKREDYTHDRSECILVEIRFSFLIITVEKIPPTGAASKPHQFIGTRAFAS